MKQLSGWSELNLTALGIGCVSHCCLCYGLRCGISDLTILRNRLSSWWLLESLGVCKLGVLRNGLGWLIELRLRLHDYLSLLQRRINCSWLVLVMLNWTLINVRGHIGIRSDAELGLLVKLGLSVVDLFQLDVVDVGNWAFKAAAPTTSTAQTTQNG